MSLLSGLLKIESQFKSIFFITSVCAALLCMLKLNFFWSRWVKIDKFSTIWVTMLSLFWIREVLWGKLTTCPYLYTSVKVTEVPSFRNMRVILSAIEEYHSAASKKRSKKLTMERLGTTCAYTARSWWPTEEYIRSVPFCRYALECGEHLSFTGNFFLWLCNFWTK